MTGVIRHLVILGHPAAHSFNGTVAEAYCEAVRACGQEAELRDLYRIRFDPLLKDAERPSQEGFAPSEDVERELALLGGCDVIALVYPIWFGMPPAIIKGYVDRVLGAGFAARNLKTATPHPLLQGKHLRLLTSSESTRPWLEEQGQWIALRQAFDRYLTSIFALASHDHLHFDAIVESLSPRYLEECRATLHERVRRWCADLAAARRRDFASHQASWPR